ncbi:MAG: helix-turn-helix transcriptional regulator [Alphaproteobacteria bacterium]
MKLTMVKTVNHPVDVHVGQKLRQRRLLVGMTQEQLADAVGVSFQMVQKYEKGARVGGSRLSLIARALGVRESFFFPEAEVLHRKVAEDKVDMDDDVLTSRETIALLKAYYALPEHLRKSMVDMMKSLKDKPEEK